MRAFGANPPESEPDPAQPSADPAQPPADPPPPANNQTYDNPSDQAAYQKLYEYNMRFTRRKIRIAAAVAAPRSTNNNRSRSDTGRRLDARNGEHEQEGRRAASIVPGQQTGPKKSHYLFWLVIALSAGAIIASFAIK